MSFIPVRLIIAMLGSYACSLVYMHRSSMSVTIVSMTDNNKLNETNQTATSNFDLSYSNKTIFNDVPTFDWNEKLQGVVLGSQFYLYIFVPTLSGRATDAYGGRWIEFFGVLGPCILAAITPFVVNTFGVTGLIINRTLLGAFHGCVYPAVFSLFVKWFPKEERSYANGALVFGGAMGSTIFYSLAGYLCDTKYGWPMVFYVLALFHVPFLILWYIYATNEPKTNARISEDELHYIQSNVQQKVISGKIKAPWLSMLVSVPVVCSLITKMCSGFGYFLLITKMPSYLSTVLGISIVQNGAFNSATQFFNGVASLIASPIANIFIHRFNMRKVVVRKIFQSIAMFGPAICLGLIPVISNNSTAVVFLLVCSMMLYGFFTAGEWTIVSEYAPNFAGTVFGFANILAFAAGVFAPYFVGILLDSDTQSSSEQWNLIFYITVIIYVVGGVVFVIFGTDKQQPWDRDAALQVQDDMSLSIEKENEINDKL